MENLEKIVLFRKIFEYHSLKDSQFLKEVWKKDLEHFFTDEIEKAWNEWRMIDCNQEKKPKPFDLIKIIRKYHKEKVVYVNKPDVLEKGISISMDLLVNNLEKMERNMPDYKKRLKEAKEVKDKLAIGFAALGIDNYQNSWASFLVNHLGRNSSV